MVIDQLNACNGDTQLDHLNDGLYGGLNAGERTNGCGNGFRQGVQANRHFGHHAQGALTAHKQTGEVVTRTRFFGARSCANDFARGGDHFKGQDIFAHGTVTHGIGTAGPGCAHAPKGGVGAWVDGEEQPS